MKKIVSLMLVLCLLACMLPMAAAAQTQNSGNGQYVNFGGYRWLILDANADNAGGEGIFLLAAEPVEAGICFQASGMHNRWAESDAKTWAAVFLAGFSQADRDAIKPVSKQESADGNWIACGLENEQVFFLSAQEAEIYLDAYAAAGNGWWLRSGYTEKGEAIYAGAVSDVGVVGTPHVAARYDARPALNLDGSKVTLYKQSGASDWEVTLSGLQAAIDLAGEGGIVMLAGDWDQNVTVQKDLYLDLNGKHISATVAVAEGATLYGMDSTTDDYNITDGYGMIQKLEGNCATHYKTECAGKIRRYLTVAESNGISFHRFYVGIQSVSLKPAITGFGYKAVFAGDEKVQAMLDAEDAFGYKLWLQDGKPVTAHKGSTDFVSGKTVSLGLKHFDLSVYGETDVHACVYMKLADGTVIESAEYVYSMRNMLETVNGDLAQYSAAQLKAVQAMLENAQVPNGWEISALRNWTE